MCEVKALEVGRLEISPWGFADILLFNSHNPLILVSPRPVLPMRSPVRRGLMGPGHTIEIYSQSSCFATQLAGLSV